MAVQPPGMARSDWKIIRAISEVGYYHNMYLFVLVKCIHSMYIEFV